MHFSALAGIAFPSSHRGLYIARIKIQGVAAATKFFGRDDRRARPTEGIVDPIALDRVISDRDFEQTHGFLSAVACAGILSRACAAHRIQIRHLPDRCLCAVTTPVARRPFLDRVPRGLVLPVIHCGFSTAIRATNAASVCGGHCRHTSSRSGADTSAGSCPA